MHSKKLFVKHFFILTEGLFSKPLLALFMLCCNCCISRLLLFPAVDNRLLPFPAEPVANKLALLLVLAEPPLEAPACAFWPVELNIGLAMFNGWLELGRLLLGPDPNTVVFVLSSSLAWKVKKKSLKKVEKWEK